MNFVSVREFRGRSGEIWKQLKQKRELIITSNGKPIALLNPISEDNFEETLEFLRRIKAEMVLDRIHLTAKKKGLDQISEYEIEEEIKAVRRNRKVKAKKRA
jgi:prevent-host-death family protein